MARNLVCLVNHYIFNFEEDGENIPISKLQEDQKYNVRLEYESRTIYMKNLKVSDLKDKLNGNERRIFVSLSKKNRAVENI